MNAPYGAKAVLSYFITGTEAGVKLDLTARTEQFAGKDIADSRCRSHGKIFLNAYRRQGITGLAFKIGYGSGIAFGAYARIAP